MAKVDGSGLQPKRNEESNMGKNQPDCANCSMRRKYESNPKSLIGRFWRWHINFCPGWKQYFAALPEDAKEDLRTRYGFHKY